MGVPTIKTGPMTVAEFYAFTDTRPDNEKWELLDGEPVLNASPSPLHQWIVKNLVVTLALQERAAKASSAKESWAKASWAVLPGLGVRVSLTNRPEPDVLIIRSGVVSQHPSERDTSEVIIAFEVLSPSTEDRDLRWKRTAYTSLPSLTHYVVIAQDAVEVVVFALAAGFAEHRLRSLADSVQLSELGLSLPLSEIYRDTGLR